MFQPEARGRSICQQDLRISFYFLHFTFYNKKTSGSTHDRGEHCVQLSWSRGQSGKEHSLVAKMTFFLSHPVIFLVTNEWGNYYASTHESTDVWIFSQILMRCWYTFSVLFFMHMLWPNTNVTMIWYMPRSILVTIVPLLYIYVIYMNIYVLHLRHIHNASHVLRVDLCNMMPQFETQDA